MKIQFTYKYTATSERFVSLTSGFCWVEIYIPVARICATNLIGEHEHKLLIIKIYSRSIFSELSFLINFPKYSCRPKTFLNLFLIPVTTLGYHIR